MLQQVKIPKITFIVAGILMMACLLLRAPAIQAQSFQGELCGGAGLKLTEEKNCPGGNQNALDNAVGAIVNVLSVIVGIAAVIMIIIGGFKFITSSGDSGRLTSAKQTIIYALVGLIIVALAQFVVRFVLNKI